MLTRSVGIKDDVDVDLMEKTLFQEIVVVTLSLIFLLFQMVYII